MRVWFPEALSRQPLSSTRLSADLRSPDFSEIQSVTAADDVVDTTDAGDTHA
ncbi:hypothetical protein M2405_006166 [Rhodococcus erythropolis]|uniref:hypothetical protein n=1 Tax=Rhodococcus erythropolis TaxID=1833 RepID=UPI002167BF45|nr:hypothetical protein [Rhodococcus erythropolis]MCS4257839.1 hypothetical protein [Rhodococcus erythropolis]MCW2425143.1 hypothetical protein [Rhodococcus erythropolis]